MTTTRRTFLRTGMAAGTAAVALSAGLLSPRQVLAAWPAKAFSAKSVDDAISALVGGSPSRTNSSDVKVDAPDIAENGAVVSVSVTTTIPNAESISILVPENNNPLAASYILSAQADGFITGRIKMRKTSDVIAVVKADGKLLTAKKAVKVTLGGCGG